MTAAETTADYQDLFEYHGSTTVEHVRKRRGSVIWRDWIIFNTVEEARDFILDAEPVGA